MLRILAQKEKIKEDTIVRFILERGLEEASLMFKFKINKTKEKRPATNSKEMKTVVNRLESLGYKWFKYWNALKLQINYNQNLNLMLRKLTTTTKMIAQTTIRDNTFLNHDSADGSSQNKISFILLNRPFKLKHFLRIYSPEYQLICADGGANRLYDTDAKLIPDLIIGDFDSVRPDVL